MDSLRKQPTCLDATTSSLTSEERLIWVNLPRGTTNQKYYPDLGSVTRNRFLDLISGETNAGVAKCRLFSELTNKR